MSGGDRVTLDRFQGCLLGLALGDALGAPHEGGLLERALWRLIGRTRQGERRWTDDTQMSIDLAESLLENEGLDPDDAARRFASSYRWSRGYGPAAAKLLKRIARGADWRDSNRAVYPEGSFGNGGAMRAPVIGLFYSSRPGELVEAARLSASITHAHPLGIEGAVLIATATASVLRDRASLDLLQEVTAVCTLTPFRSRLQLAEGWLKSGTDIPVKDVRRQLGNRISASESCVTALYCALRFRDGSFDRMQQFVASCRGDVDTIGAMAGAVWGAANGITRLPAEGLGKLEQRSRLTELASALYGRVDAEGRSRST